MDGRAQRRPVPPFEAADDARVHLARVFEAASAEIRGENDAPGSPPGFRLDRMGLVIEVPESEIAYPNRVFLACGAIAGG